MSRGPYYEPGRYWGKILEQAMAVTKTQKPQFVLKFLVIGRVDPANPDGELISCYQYERYVYRVITENTIDYMMQDLEVLGYDRETFKDLDPKTPNFCDFTGKELAFFCTHETNEGVQREKWGIARASNGISAKPLEPKAARDLDNLFGKHLKKNRAAVAAKPKPAPVDTAGAEIPEDDIPF